MNILTVIPIIKGMIRGSLTYFTKNSVPKGSIVSVPIRKKKACGIVTEIKSAEKAKLDIKSLPYSIKKIENIKSTNIFSESFLQSARTISDYYASNIGSVLFALIPNAILENSAEIIYEPKKTADSNAKKRTPVLAADDRHDCFYETVLLQSDDEERYATYKSLIREEFARGKSVFFCLPTTEDLKNAKHTLEKGIENYTYVLHSLLTKKEIVKIWQKIIDEPHPVLIIATGPFLSLPRDDISTIIIEKESSRAYKMQTRPYIDLRTAAQIFAKESQKRLVLGDTLLRAETLWEERQGNYAELSPLKYRSLTAAQCEIIDTRTPKDQKKKEFSIFSDKLKSVLREAKENNERTFLFAGRKGLYPATVCSDCGTVVSCKNCNAPVVLYSKSNGKLEKKGGLFVCHHCGERRDAKELCKHCGGWRLTPLGIGTEQVAELVKEMLKDSHVVIFDKENVKTHAQAVKARDLFYSTPGSILVGTEMALTYLSEPIENTAVVSLDSFFSIPDFRINEKIFHILLALRSMSEKNMLIQTRQDVSSPNRKIFEYAVRGNLMDFYRDEIEDRKMIGYPPFATYIKITIEGEKTAAKKLMQEIANSLKPYELLIFDAFNPGGSSKFTVHGLISLDRGVWVHKELLEKLRSLHPSVSVRVDPDTLL